MRRDQYTPPVAAGHCVGKLPCFPSGIAWQKSSTATRDVAASRPPSRYPDIPISCDPESPKPGKLSPRPFALVLNVVLIDLQPLFAKGDQDLVPDGDAGFGVTAA